MSQEFIARAERIIDALLESSAETALVAGDHRFDDRLDDYSTEAVAQRVDMLREASHALAEVDDEDLTAADAIDLETLSNQVAARLFTLTETRDHEWDPLLYNPGTLLNTLLLRPTASAEERLSALTARLRAIPDSLATARGNLTQVPAIFAETGAEQFAGTAALVRQQVPRLLAEAPGMAAEVNAAIDTAATELDGFAAWLAQLPEGRSPRLGRRTWEAKLWHTLDTPMAAATILERAWARLELLGDEIAETAAAITGRAASADNTATALAGLAAERPDNATIVALARQAMAETTAFVAEHELVSLSDDPVEIVVMPEFARGVSAAYCDPPGALDTTAVPTFYAISPTPAGWNADQVESFFTEYNNHMVRDLTVHEAMPGHYLQLAHARRYRGNTRARAITMSGTFVEGWAVYAEELLAEHGYGGLPVRMQQLKMQLRMTINAIIDQLIHCEDMSQTEALALMTERGFQSASEAAGKWRRALLSSTQLSTYFVGYSEVAEIARARPADRTPRQWHDAMLAHGNPAPRHLRMILGV